MIIEHTFPVKGMSCASCSAHVAKALRSVSGVVDVNVNLPMNNAKVKYDDALCSPADMARAVYQMGFELVVEAEATNDATSADESQSHAEPSTLEEQDALSQKKRQAFGALALAVPLLVLGVFPKLFAGQEVASFFLAAMSLWKYGRVFYASALKLLRHGTSNMDTLVALSITVSFVYSFFNLFFPQWFVAHGMQPHLYFDSVGVITAFILLGRLLEAKAKHRTTQSIRRLMRLQPQEVTCVFPNGVQHTKHLKDVKPGDVLLAHPGDRIAVDGVVVNGSSNVDESALSGEPIPVEKSVGSKVMAGTINKHGTLTYRTERAASDTLLAQIIRMVQDAQGSKVPVQAMVDRIAAIFVPSIVIISLLTLAIWLLIGGQNGLTHGLVAMVSVLVIACPCSLGLATPTAIIVGIGRGASMGILVKDATCLERAERIDAVVLDKTGTITQGFPEVKEAWFAHQADLRSILFSIEQLSTHPLAEAVSQYLKRERTREVTDFAALPGHGVRGNVGENTYWVGSMQLMREKSVTFAPEQQRQADAWTANAYTLVAMTDGTQLLALLALADEVKSTSAAAISQLKALGITTYMLTGDNEATAAAVAREVGIDHIKAHTLPTEKANFVRQLQVEGHKVAMVGDGINDSAALAVADLSVAMGRGSDVAIDTAMITLLTSDLARLPQAIRLSQRTVRTIRENLFWAFFYNVISVPIAAGVLYPVCGFMLSPMIAGAAMALSSVSVVSNSIRSGIGKV